MMLPTPPRYRTRTHELGPFWSSMDYCRHPRFDPEVRAAEFAGLLPLAAGALLAAGFTCQRQVEACPDWLLLSVPNLGKVRLGQIRRILPYRRDIYRRPYCPGHEVERRRGRDDATEGRQLDFLMRQVRLHLAVERQLYGIDNPMEPR